MDKLGALLLMLLVVFSPAAFGLTEYWSIVISETICVVLACCILFSTWFFRIKFVKVPALPPLILLLCFIIFQVIPLPAQLIKFVSPGTYTTYSPLLFGDHAEKWLPISINSKATIQEFFRIFSYVSLYFFSVQYFSQSPRIKQLVGCIVIVGTIIAIIALSQQKGPSGYIYWFRKAPEGSNPFGPWVNPNQYAGFVNIVSPIALALCLYFRPRFSDDMSWKEKLIHFISSIGMNSFVLSGAAFLILAVSVFVSLSRGGIISLTCGILFFLMLYKFKRRKNNYLGIVLLVCGAIFLLWWLTWNNVSSEFIKEIDKNGHITDTRLALWKDCFSLFLQFPVTGSGFGTFLYAYPLTKTIHDRLIYDHAHNDYIEMLTDGGVFGTGLALWFVIAILSYCWKRISLRRDRYIVLVGIGLLTSVITVLIHSLVDFNFHNGAIGLFFSLHCGLLVSLANSKFSYASAEAFLPSADKKLTIQYGIVFLLGAIVFLIVQAGTITARYKYSLSKNTYISSRLKTDKLDELVRSFEDILFYDPLEATYIYQYSMIHWFLQHKEASIAELKKAAFKNPMEAAYLEHLGLLVEDKQQKDLLLENALKRALNKTAVAASYVEYLLKNGRKNEAISIIRNDLTENSSAWQQWQNLAESYSMTYDDFGQALPDNVGIWFNLGKLKLELKDTGQANFYFTKTLELFEKDATPHPDWWYHIMITFFSDIHQKDKSILVLRHALASLPSDKSFHIKMGHYYLEEGILFKAAEQFNEALTLDPDDMEVRKAIRELEKKKSGKNND